MQTRGETNAGCWPYLAICDVIKHNMLADRLAASNTHLRSIISDIMCQTSFSDALKEMLSAFKEPHNVERIEEAKEKGGTDLLKYMQYVSPIIAQIQISCIKHYGYSENGQGEAYCFP